MSILTRQRARGPIPPGVGERARTRREFQVILRLTMMRPDSGALESAADEALAVLTESAAHVALGPVVGVDFEQNTIEVEMTVEAESPSVLHQKVGLVLAILQEEGPFELVDSSASRLEEPAFSH